MRCASCGFVFDQIRRDRISDRIRGLARTYAAPRTASRPAYLRTHPTVAVWLPLEYGCHVRDVLIVERGDYLRRGLEQANTRSRS